MLLSGAGSTFQHLHTLSQAGELPIAIATVISSVAGAAGLDRARAAGIPATLVARAACASRAEFGHRVTAALEAAEVELVLMAGLIHLWPVPPRYAGHTLNVHPALIPAFCGQGYYDRRVHEAVVASGVRITGCTVHFADDHYDHGPIILQRAVPVDFHDTADTVRARVQAAEREAYPAAIRLYAAGRLRIEGRRVEILAPPTG